MAGIVGSELPEKLRRLSPKSLRFGKRVRQRGHYFQDVRDQHGKLVARVPWNQRVKREVRAAVEVVSRKETRRSLEELGLVVPGWKYESGSFDVEYGSARWSRDVFTSAGVPIGEPQGRVRGRRRGRSGKWLGAVFESVEPLAWRGLLARLPDRLQEADASNFRLRITVTDREGKRHVVTDPTERFIQDLQFPGEFREMLATACSIAGQRYGYAGAVELTGIEIIMGGQAEGAEGLEEQGVLFQ